MGLDGRAEVGHRIDVDVSKVIEAPATHRACQVHHRIDARERFAEAFQVIQGNPPGPDAGSTP